MFVVEWVMDQRMPGSVCLEYIYPRRERLLTVWDDQARLVAVDASRYNYLGLLFTPWGEVRWRPRRNSPLSTTSHHTTLQMVTAFQSLTIKVTDQRNKIFISCNVPAFVSRGTTNHFIENILSPALVDLLMAFIATLFTESDDEKYLIYFYGFC